MNTLYRTFDVQKDFKEEIRFVELSLQIKDQKWINFDYIAWRDFNGSSKVKQ